MKTGLEQRRKVIAAVALFILAIYFGWSSLTGRQTPVSAAPTTMPAPKAPSKTTPQRRMLERDKRAAGQERSLDPTLRFDWLKAGESVEYKGGKCNIFTAECGQVAAVKPKQPPPPNCSPGAPPDPRCGPPPPNCSPGAAPDPRCPPPPIPLQFFGFASRPGEPKRIFLRTTDTNDVFVAGEGEVVNRRFRVLRIMGSGVEIEDVLNNNKQVIPLNQG
jgi:hypothetical protein